MIQRHSISNILIVAAHPDDEMLGCGGSLARLRQESINITVLLLGEGPTARIKDSALSEEVCENSHCNAIAASSVLGITDVRFGNLPDNSFDTIPFLAIVKLIESVAAEVRPDLIFTHHAGDLNVDHRLTHQAVLTAFRPLPEAKPVTILAFEVLSSTEYTTPNSLPPFLPNLYIDISTNLELKLQALRAYDSEMRPFPHPRSYEAVNCLARLRGSECGVEAAEAFVLCRGVY